jgi:UDPglucose 6-dehydrogenase
VGYGGPCFPRDNSALAAAAAQVGARAEIALATDVINRRQVDRVVGVVAARATAPHHRIGVLGLSYKPDTPVVEESQGVMLANRLAADGFPVTVYDPAALPDAGSSLDPSIQMARSLPECVDDADLLVLMVPWPAFGAVPALLRARPGKPRVIVDCWRLLDPAELEGLAEPVYLGKAQASATAETVARQS